MDIHLVRFLQDVDEVNVLRKPAKWGERPAFFSVHVDSYECVFNIVYDLYIGMRERYNIASKRVTKETRLQ